MVIIYRTKKSYESLLKEKDLVCEEAKLLNGSYKLRVFCYRYQEEYVRNKVKNLIPGIKEIGVKK